MAVQGGGVQVKQRRYLCPQCFTSHFWNDVLFASRRDSDRYDLRQAARRRELCTPERFQQWCRKGKSPVLLNWRALPEERRQWKEGAIAAVRDMDGTWLDQRVCPCCHTPLPRRPFPVVVGWQEDGYSSALADALLRTAVLGEPRRWRLHQEEDAPVRYSSLVTQDGAIALGAPLLPEGETKGYAANCVARCCAAAEGAVLRLRMEPDGQGGLDGQAALTALWGLQEACGCASPQRKLAVVCLLEGVEQPDGVERFRQKCTSLAREIEYSFESSYFAAGTPEDPRAVVKAVIWLCEHISGLDGEGSEACG